MITKEEYNVIIIIDNIDIDEIFKIFSLSKGTMIFTGKVVIW